MKRSCFIKFKTFCASIFKLKEHQSNLNSEFLGGLSTFLAMSYILFVNPLILSKTGMPIQGVFIATIFGTVVGTLMMALFANMPYAAAPGMGLNAFFTYTVVFSLGYTWQQALAMVFICGLINMLVTVTRVRSLIITAIPNTLKYAIGAGIGVFLTYIGLKNAGFLEFILDPGTYFVIGKKAQEAQATIIGNSQAIPSLVRFNSLSISVAIFGLFVSIFFVVKKIKVGTIISIFLSTILAIILGVVDLKSVDFSKQNLSTAFVDFGKIFGQALGRDGFVSLFSDWRKLPEVLLAILAFSLTDIFDSVGTFISMAQKVDSFKEETGSLEFFNTKRIKRALFSDMVGTTTGAIFGTSNVTTYIESAVGISSGAKTGLSSLFVSLFFILSTFLAPLVTIVPSVAVAPVLIVVGASMFASFKKINWSDLDEAIPAFFASIFMAFTFSITTGIAVGFIFYTFVKLVKWKPKDIHPIIWVFDLLFILNFVSLALVI